MNSLLFETLFHLHYKKLCIYALRYIPDKDIAEDIVQNFFVSIWENNIQLTEDNILPYATISIRNSCINYYKTVIAQEAFLNNMLEKMQSLTKAEESFIYQNEVRTAIRKLPKKCRKVFLLRCIRELKYKEIAEIMGISVNTVKYHLGEAFRIMREELKDLL